MKIFKFFQKPVASLNDENKFRTLLEQKVPQEAVNYCVNLWLKHPFSFKSNKNRERVLGNYTYRNRQHKITVNEGLNSYSYLITLIHEIAHQHVQINFKKSPPHGLAWKTTFKELLNPLLNSDVFPDDLLLVLNNHMENPKASSSADPKLVKILKKYDAKNNEGYVFLNDIKEGQHFEFRNQTYVFLEKRRTRCLVKNLNSQRNYTIPLIAEVTLI